MFKSPQSKLQQKTNTFSKEEGKVLMRRKVFPVAFLLRENENFFFMIFILFFLIKHILSKVGNFIIPLAFCLYLLNSE